jgi:hypothetical protein
MQGRQECGVIAGLFPAKAGPTKDSRALPRTGFSQEHPVWLARRAPCGTGFSREGVGRCAANPTNSHLNIQQRRPQRLAVGIQRQ